MWNCIEHLSLVTRADTLTIIQVQLPIILSRYAEIQKCGKLYASRYHWTSIKDFTCISSFCTKHNRSGVTLDWRRLRMLWDRPIGARHWGMMGSQMDFWKGNNCSMDRAIIQHHKGGVCSESGGLRTQCCLKGGGGGGGKMSRLIQRMYDENERSFRLCVCVWGGGGIKGRRLGRNKGLRQRCILSPLLFAIYIGKAVERMERSRLGIEIRGVTIRALIFEDDIVLCGGSEIELSQLLGIIWQELDKLGLVINEAKNMVLQVGECGEVRERGEVRSSEGQWRIMTAGLDGDNRGGDYKYLRVMVSNLGEVQSSGATMGGEAITRKAQVQAAVVQDEIRDGYDRMLEGKIIWEKKLTGHTEVADVEDRVLEELEAIQVWLGRVILGASGKVGGECVLRELGWLPMKLWMVARRIGFYWRLRSVDDHVLQDDI